VRLRREVLPLLEDVLGGGATEALARTAGLLRDDLDALDALAAALLEQRGGIAGIPPAGSVDHGTELDVAALAAQPRAVRTRVLRAWAHRNGTAPLSAEHTAALDALVTDWHGQGPLDLPGGRRAARASGKLMLNPTPPSDLQEY
jgi:tRNA(Ile)-lysidine synthase